MNGEDLKRKVCAAIDRRQEDMIRVAKTMLGHPELGYREVKTTSLVREVLKGLSLPLLKGDCPHRGGRHALRQGTGADGRGDGRA